MRCVPNEGACFSFSGSVGILGSITWTGERGVNYLSTEEKRCMNNIGNATRRRKWLAGRIAGKYLYLKLNESGAERSINDAALVFQIIERRELEKFAPIAYRRVEILADRSEHIPRVRDNGSTTVPHISIAHTAYWSCAYMAPESPIGIDLESVAPRVEAFYRSNFTGAEVGWVKQEADDTAVPRLWFYTVLWAVKEATLKAHCHGDASVWNIPGIGIYVPPKVVSWAHMFRQEQLGAEFVFFTVGVSYKSAYRMAHVALTATHNLILVILRAEVDS